MIVVFGEINSPYKSPEAVIDTILENTTPDGRVWIGEWNDGSVDKIPTDYNSLYCVTLKKGVDGEALKEQYRSIAAMLKALSEKEDYVSLSSKEAAFWARWVMPADTSSFDKAKIERCEEETARQLKLRHLKEKAEAALSFEEYEHNEWFELQEDYKKDLGDAREEYDRYCSFLCEDACSRLGGGIWQPWRESGRQGAEPLCTARILHEQARRILRLMRLNAPLGIIQREEEILAANLLLQKAMTGMKITRLR